VLIIREKAGEIKSAEAFYGGGKRYAKVSIGPVGRA
jgi:hypothetical protein